MSIAKCFSAHLVGLTMEVITVEVDISNGLNSLSIVGLGDRAIEEAKDRVSAAIKNSGFTSPKQKNQKVVISLAPADVRKEGPAFDLAIAIAYLAAAGEITGELDKTLFLGELSLEGDVRRIAGVLPMICQARRRGFERVFIPSENAEEASMMSGGISAYAVSALNEVVAFISGKANLSPVAYSTYNQSELLAEHERGHDDMKNIRGNEGGKRAMEVAAAGAHNLLMFGPPGTGKPPPSQFFRTAAGSQPGSNGHR